MAATVTLEVKLKPSKEWEAILDCVNLLGSALADHNHQWTNEERRAFEKAERTVRRLVEAKGPDSRRAP